MLSLKGNQYPYTRISYSDNATRSLLERRHVSISLFASVWYCWPTNGKQNISFVGATYIVPYIHSLRVNHLICLRGLTKMPNLTEKGVLSKVFGTNFWTIDDKWFCSWTWDIASDREIKKYKILIILFLTFLLISLKNIISLKAYSQTFINMTVVFVF